MFALSMLAFSFQDFAEAIARFGMTWIAQSTLLITLGFLVGAALARAGSPTRSLVYRSVLVAVCLCPLATFVLTKLQLSQFSVLEPLLPSRLTTENTAAGITDLTVVPLPLANPFQSRSGDAIANLPSTDTAIGTPPISDAPIVSTVPLFDSAETTSRPPPDFLRLAVCVSVALWFSISVCLLVRLMTAHRRLWRTLGVAKAASTFEQQRCDELAGELGVKSPRVVRSPYFASPFLAGIREVVIHLPSDDSEADDCLRDVLIHELAHLKRRDCAWRLFHQAVLSVFFFQPLLWRLIELLEAVAEDVCDDYVVNLGASRPEYARLLVDLAERSDFPLAPAVGIASGKSMLERRVRRIMDASRVIATGATRRVRCACVIGALLLMTLVGTLFVRSATAIAQTPEQNSILAQKGATDAVTTVDRSTSDERVIRGVAVGSSGPIANAEVYWWRSRVHDMDPMQPIRTVTDDKGQFVLRCPGIDLTEPGAWDMREEMIVRAKGYGFRRDAPHSDSQNGSLWNAIVGGLKAYEVPPEGQPIHGRLLDIDGQPIEGARVRIRYFTAYRRPSEASPTDEQLDKSRRQNVNSLLQVIEQVPMRDALPLATSDHDGRFELNGLPERHLFQLLVERDGIQSTDLVVCNFGEKVVTLPPPVRQPTEPTITVYPANFQAVIGPSNAIAGQVTDLDTGQPIAGALVRAVQVHGESVSSSREREHFATRTDKDGRYQIAGMPLGAENQLVAFTTDDTPYMPVAADVDTSGPAPVVTQDFALKRGIWATGRVYDAKTNEAFQGEVTYYWFRDRALEQEYPGILRAYVDGRYFTNADGEFKIPVFRVPGVIAFSTGNRDQDRMAPFPRGSGEQELKTYAGPNDKFPRYETVPFSLMPGNYNRLALVEPKPEAAVVAIDMAMRAIESIAVTVVDSEGQTVDRDLQFYGGNERFGWWAPKSSREFFVEDLLPGSRRKVFAMDRAQGLVGGTIVDHESGGPFKIRLAKAGEVHGRIVDDGGAAITDATISIEYGDFQNDEITGMWADVVGKRYMPCEVETNGNGEFTIEGLAPDWKYSARISQPREGFSRIVGAAFSQLQIKPGETRDLGDIVIKEE